jgi:signal transduction histidine kinase/CheY-like chemotaxis protein
VHHQQPADVTANATSTTLTSNYDFFSNFGNYMPKTHCLLNAEGKPDWPWIGILIALNVTEMVGYLKIFRFWRHCYLAEAPEDRNTKLMDLAGIFLLCGFCGYGFFIVTVFWPGYRLLAAFMVALSIFTWRFAADLSEFRLSFSAKRIHREFQESLKNRNRELEALVASRTADLERANKFKGEFIANISHELRTPMTAILGFADLLADGQSSEAERTDYVDTIRRNGNHLLGLVNDVLDVSQIEAGKLSVERVPCNLNDQISHIIETFAPRAEKAGIALAADITPDVPASIMTDPLRLRQILTNLVGNAMKFTKTGSVGIHVNLLPRPDRAPLVKIAVRDTGRGMAPADMDALFERFGQRGVRQRSPGSGSGLGLPISRGLARLLGGDITVTSTPGVGSTFVVTLDVGLTPLNTLPSAVATGQLTKGLPLMGMKVLIAEDVADSRAYLSTLIKRWGATADCVEDGQAALDRGMTETFDLVLMDIEMPILDGLDATRQLRAKGYAGPIIALTANAMIGDRNTCLNAGCTDYAAKPLDAEKLLQTIRRALTQRAAVTV